MERKYPRWASLLRSRALRRDCWTRSHFGASQKLIDSIFRDGDISVWGLLREEHENGGQASSLGRTQVNDKPSFDGYSENIPVRAHGISSSNRSYNRSYNSKERRLAFLSSCASEVVGSLEKIADNASHDVAKTVIRRHFHGTPRHSHRSHDCEVICTKIKTTT